ncbi:MAG: response regulator transcription factor [Bacteroidota bacterium]
MSITVSIVEDNTIFRNSLVQLIGSLPGVSLVSAYANGEEAVQLTKDDPDIVIMDIELPGISGIELIKKLKPLNQRIQYLICSSYEDDERIFAALDSGASGYILKDYTAAAIGAAVHELYQGGVPLKPSVARRVLASFQKKYTPADFSLTAREKEILELAARGLIYKEIAERLSISHETVKKHLKNIYNKMHVQNRIEAINKFNLL